VSDNIEIIIKKAGELSALIKHNQVTLDYINIRAKINGDRKAQELYSKLVMIGKEISSRLERGELDAGKPTSEYEIMHRELEQNPLVKEYIRSQKNYLDLITMIIDRIKNPH